MSDLSVSDGDWRIEWNGSKTFNIYYDNEEVDISSLYGRDGNSPTEAEAIKHMRETLRECLAGER